MRLCVMLLGLFGLSAAAPQNWPYRDSLMPYRYGYPSQSQYKYLPEVEDDEDTGPYLSRLHGRQDLVIGSEGDRVRPTSEPGISSSVVETGSVAPVVEPSRYTKAPPQATTSPTHKPVGVDTGRPVQPPPFPPARPPPTPPPSEKPDEEGEDDESEEDADDDLDPNNDGDDDDGEDDQTDADGNDDGEDDEEEERRRQEPLVITEEKLVENVPVVPTVPAVVTSTVSPIPPKVQANKTAVVTANSTKSGGSKVTEGEEVDSSEEQGVPGIEALVPGYVTDQGEVLVPVDTVTGDQPISIVPDPYGQPARGVQLPRVPSYRGPYEDSDDYETPYYFSDVYQGGIRRQDSEDVDLDIVRPTKGQGKGPATATPSNEKDNVVEVVDEVEDDEEVGSAETESGAKDTDSLESELEGRNEYMTSFPPSRTPELFALIKSRIPVDSSSDYEDNYSGYNGPYAYNQQQQPQPQPQYYFKPRPQQQSVSLALSLSGGQQGYNMSPYNYNRRFPTQQGYQGYPYGGMQGYDGSYQMHRPSSAQFYRRPVAAYRPQYSGGYQQSPAYRPFSGYQQSYAYNKPPQFSGYQQYPSAGYRPNQFSGGYQSQYQFGNYDRPVYRPFASGQGQGQGQGQSVYIARPNIPLRRPVQGGYLRPTAVRITPLRKPTPVIKQKKNPNDSYEIPYADASVDISSGAIDSMELPKVAKTAFVKTRRSGKMAKNKKPNKKLQEPKKTMGDPDPLNILKKINAKRS